MELKYHAYCKSNKVNNETATKYTKKQQQNK